jgi:hypothetical protein
LATRRARIHSRDIQPQVAAPKGLFAAARVQRLDFPLTVNTTDIDELGRKLHVGTTSDIPAVTVTLEAFDVSHNTYAYFTGYTPSTFPASGVSITELKNVDVIGQIRDKCGNDIVNSIYVKRGIVTAMNASFGVQANSTVSYTINANSKKAFREPVFYDRFTTSGSGDTLTLSHAPTWLTRTSGYTIDGYFDGGVGCDTNFIDEGLDYTVTGSTVTISGGAQAGTYWFTYTSPITTQTFQALDNTAPAAIQGKYVPLSISVNSIPRVQSATIAASFTSDQILEMGGLGKPVGYEIGTPSVTGDLSVLKTDNDLLAILEGVPNTTVENDVEFALTSLPLKIQLKDPRNPSRVVLTYYVPSITITAQGDASAVNASIDETFSWKSTTGELFVASGVGPW